MVLRLGSHQSWSEVSGEAMIHLRPMAWGMHGIFGMYIMRC